MPMHTKRLSILLVIVFSVALAACQSDDGVAPGEVVRVYDVTVENLTSSQPMSPGVIVTHAPAAVVWRVGQRASEGIRLIAENGDPSVATTELTGAAGIHDLVTSDAPLHRIGFPGPRAATYRLSTLTATARLSFAMMLICTNDGIVGLDSVALPSGFTEVTYMATAYDAGTEDNGEHFVSIPDPCQVVGPVKAPPDGNQRTRTDFGVTEHPGIQSVSDLGSEHAWDGAVARVTVRRLQ